MPFRSGTPAEHAVVLGSAEASRLGVRTAPRCDRVYVDISRNGTRRFCSTACQNRVTAAVFRERQGGGSAGSSPRKLARTRAYSLVGGVLG